MTVAQLKVYLKQHSLPVSGPFYQQDEDDNDRLKAMICMLVGVCCFLMKGKSQGLSILAPCVQVSGKKADLLGRIEQHLASAAK